MIDDIEKMLDERTIKHREAQARYRKKKIDELKERNASYYRQQQELKKSDDLSNEMQQKFAEKDEKHRLAQAKYRQKIDNYKMMVQAVDADAEDDIVDPLEKTIDIDEILDMYKDEIKTRTTIKTLKDITINGYIYKIGSIHKKLPDQVKDELKKMFLKLEFDEKMLIDEFSYLYEDINKTIVNMRKLYQNDNSFRGYISVLSLIASHLTSIDKSIFQTLGKVYKYYMNDIKEHRKDNLLSLKDEGKIIDLDRDIILSNLEKLEKLEDKLLFGLYTLFPARRLDWRLVRITRLKTVPKDEYNYLILGNKNKKIVFNNYKTDATYQQQIFNIDDKVLDKLFNDYIIEKRFKENDYLFNRTYKTKATNEALTSAYFSKKIMDTFEKVYGKRIGASMLRSSWATWINKQPLSIKQKEEYMNKMAHSFNESQLYVKLN